MIVALEPGRDVVDFYYIQIRVSLKRNAKLNHKQVKLETVGTTVDRFTPINRKVIRLTSAKSFVINFRQNSVVMEKN